ncbi:MAG TPA: DUF4012 domain-containing protein [Candidatus Saccharimonadales bacterium]|nr:DUF4012 domain-containing protein [Candidatus Saccharimonadales bacterium]
MSETKFWSPNGNANMNLNTGSKVKRKIPKWLAVLGGIFIGVVVFVLAILYFTLYGPAMAVVSKANLVKADLSAVKDSVVSRDLVSLDANLSKTSNDLKDLKAARDANLGWAANFGPTKDYYSDSNHFINASFSMIDAAKQASILVRPFADAAGLKVSAEQKTPDNVSLLDAFTTWITVMPQVADHIDTVLTPMAQAGKELSYVDANRYPENLRGIAVRDAIVKAQTLLSQVNNYGPDIKKALVIVPQLLGVSTPQKRYMIIMQNNKEMRATGGFWTNYATFRLDDGRLANNDITSKDMYSIDIALNAIDAYYTFPKAPASYNKYLKVERLYARDANISPDFPTAVDQFMVFYKLAMNVNPLEVKPIDGIFAIDTEVVKEMMTITGPVTINGTTYTTDNVVLELEKLASLSLAEQANRKGILGTLMKAMLNNVFQSDKNLWSQLIDKGIDLTYRKHIIAYSFNPDAQALLEKYNIAGRIMDPVVGDYSYVVTTNLGGDKTNWFVNKSIDNSLTKDSKGWLRTVHVKYTYNNPDGIYGPFVKRYQDWLRVYAPLGSTFVGVDGSDDGTSTDQERNKVYYTAWVTLEPGATKDVTFKYYLPDTLIGKDGIYHLYVQKQPGIDADTYSITVNGKTQPISLKSDYQYSAKL